MKKVLRINTSLFDDGSVSSRLNDELLGAIRNSGEVIEVVERDFQQQPIPHVDGEWLQAISTPAEERNDEQQAKAAFSDNLIAEIQAADTLLIGLPMYNFTVPSMLKAWVDHIARAGVTFAYTEQGPKGLLEGKKVYLVAAMGGIHDTAATDFLRPYMQLIMGFIGLTDVEVVTANGLNMGDERRAEGLASAREQIENLFA